MYKCVKGFLIDVVDGDGFTIEEGGYEVEEGTIWKIDECISRIIGGEVRLTAIDDETDWMEMCKETLEEHFIEIS